MVLLKCKMCGGDIEVSENMTFGACLYCGSSMTLPQIVSDKKVRMFNRANQYRQGCDFDKAYRAFEAIVEEDEEEAEAYWGMVLSEYGVQYVEDPKNGKRIPTCHRTLTQYVRDNVNYKNACKYADIDAKFVYEDEAEEIEKIQKQILAISTKEEPYDIFICYKETDDITGERTQDSVLAYKIYEELEKNNIRSFMARVSLHDKLGEDYEPYIYSALSSAQIMIIVATNGDYCNSVWVKNEWMRFLSFMKEDSTKVVIPIYQDMSPYEFPLELSRYQAQDMRKIGALQDLVIGVQRVLKRRDFNKDKILHELMFDKENREKKVSQFKRMACMLLIMIIVIAFPIISLKTYSYMKIKKYERLLSEDVVETYDDIPSCDEYSKIILDLDANNFSEYFNLVGSSKEKTGYYLNSCLYDDGWIYIGDIGLSKTVSIKDNKSTLPSRLILDSSSDENLRNNLLPTYISAKGQPTIQYGVALHANDTFKVVFVSKNMVENYQFIVEENSYVREVILKDGNIYSTIITKDIGEDLIMDNLF